MEYVSLAKTRLADLKVRKSSIFINGIIKSYFIRMHVHVCLQESVEDMGLYGDVSGAGGATAQVKVTSLLHVIYCTCNWWYFKPHIYRYWSVFVRVCVPLLFFQIL